MAAFFGVLTNPHTRAYYAACYEAEQAEREFSETYASLAATGYRAGSPEDYALWSVGSYADSTARLVRTMPVWEV